MYIFFKTPIPEREEEEFKMFTKSSNYVEFQIQKYFYFPLEWIKKRETISILE